MASHAGEVNEGQVIIERIDAMVTTTAARVKTVTADALLWQNSALMAFAVDTPYADRGEDPV